MDRGLCRPLTGADSIPLRYEGPLSFMEDVALARIKAHSGVRHHPQGQALPSAPVSEAS